MFCLPAFSLGFVWSSTWHKSVIALLASGYCCIRRVMISDAQGCSHCCSHSAMFYWIKEQGCSIASQEIHIGKVWYCKCVCQLQRTVYGRLTAATANGSVSNSSSKQTSRGLPISAELHTLKSGPQTPIDRPNTIRHLTRVMSTLSMCALTNIRLSFSQLLLFVYVSFNTVLIN